MRRSSVVAILFVALIDVAIVVAQTGSSQGLRAPALNETLDAKGQQALALQVALDRAGFSPGEIDAAPGTNTERALRAYREAKRVPAGATSGEVTGTLGEMFTNPLVSYTITTEDVAGPFLPIPSEMTEKAALPTLAYSSLLELLGERFHASPKLLQRLNPRATFAAREAILVPNVEPFTLPSVSAAKPTIGPVMVTVTDRTKSLQVNDSAGETIFHAPVTVGSENDPLPIGAWKIAGVSVNPPFHYNPKLFWDADPSDSKAKIAPGPNNPVGVVWIDLSKPHYGIHGTPEPSRIGHTESHGCIRLTNWDAMRLRALVAPGTTVILE